MAFKMIRPLGRTLYVKLLPVAEKTSGGGRIIVARMHSETTRVGEVLMVGDECQRNIKIGDKIIVSFHAGTVIDWAGDLVSDDDTVRLIDEYEALAIVDF